METFLTAIGLGSRETTIVLEVVTAMILGGVIGYDREAADKPAGLRTHMLVAGAAALLVGLGSLIVSSFEDQLLGSGLQTDPIRIFEALITGVSFLGAGTIIQHRGEHRVQGITTAASLLMTAAIGATVGLSEWALAAVLTILVYVVLHLLRRVTLVKKDYRVG